MVAELVRETGDPPRVVELREQTRRQKSRNETEYIKISQNQYTDKAVDVTVVIEEIVTLIQTCVLTFSA